MIREWAMLTVSLINTILLLWLGFTVLLNAERRVAAVYVISGGLLVAGVFFVSHTAIIGHGLTSLDRGLNLWWHVGLAASGFMPFVWYSVTLWYTGYWEDKQSSLYKRQTIWFWINGLLTLMLGGLLLFANPFPSYEHVVTLKLSQTPTIKGIPLLIIGYIVCSGLSTGLAVDALWHPGPARRMMGDKARHRARPWLILTSIILLLVVLLVAGVMVWVVINANRLPTDGLYGRLAIQASYLDLLISTCITAAVICVGQAIVRYEVFTGKTLPQQRFRRHWRNVVIAAVTYGLVMGAGLQMRIHPIYSVLLTALMLTIFYALFNQYSYIERERYIQHLRPFITSQHLYDHLIADAVPAEVDISLPFHTLCQDVLGAQFAYLAAVGPLAPLVGPAQVYPHNVQANISLVDVVGQFKRPQTICVPLDSKQYSGAAWAIPLWSERGLIGVLLLGEKLNGGLYTQEEIEIARASGERLIDTRASAEMARRLMQLQRQRLAENHVVDNRTRRMLHDDILPHLHTAMIMMSSSACTPEESVQVLASIHHEIADLLREMPANSLPALSQDGLVKSLRNMVEKEWVHSFEAVSWHIDCDAESRLEKLPALTSEAIYYAVREAIRNAARHGRGKQSEKPLHLRLALDCSDQVQITIEDDGVGLDTVNSTVGSGNGLALHTTMIAVLGGTLSVESKPFAGTCVRLGIPLD